METSASGVLARRITVLAVALLVPGASPGLLPGGSGSLRAQESGGDAPGDTASTVEGPRPAKWSAEVDFGIRLPGVLYDNFVDRRIESPDSTVREALRTRYTEESRTGYDVRATLNLYPESSASGYVAFLVGGAETEARFSGGGASRSIVQRSMSYRGVEVGINMRLKEWAGGRGVFGYNIGATYIRHSIDLDQGHRPAYARLGDAGAAGMPEWSERSYGAWGLAMGTTFRIPVTDRFAVRTNFRDLVVPVNTSALAVQEEQDVEAFTGETPTFTYGGYTAHHLSLDLGIEYTFAWGRARPQVDRRIPSRREEEATPAAVKNAVRTATRGDTARAIEILRHQVGVLPENGPAWRELAVLLAAEAEDDPSRRDEAMRAVRRALNLNPGDAEVLRAFGRIRGLLDREGPAPATEEARSPLGLSDVTVEVAEGGDVRMAWAVRGLTPDEGGDHRFRYEIDVLTAEGGSVRIRPYGGDLGLTSGGTLMATSSADEMPATVRANLFLLEPEPGIYTARVRVTDLETGASTVRTGSFEIP